MESWRKIYTWCIEEVTNIRNIKIMSTNSRKPFTALKKPK
jgi:hypothetical protein